MKTRLLIDGRSLVAALALLGATIPAPAAEIARQPVSVARGGFTPEQVARAHAGWVWEELFKTGDVSLYMFLHASEFYPSALVRRSGPVVDLEEAPSAKAGAIRTKSALGEMSLDEYLDHPESRAQGMIVVHQGKIALETYPGMRDDDSHLSMSVGKTTVSLVIALLEAEGKIDVQQTFGAYVPALKDTAWSGIKVIDVLDMSSGLDVVESAEARVDITSAFNRLVRAFFNVPGADGKSEKHTDVIRSVKKLREPGQAFQYSSMNTQVLVILAEAVENKSWAEIFQSRVWSKLSAEGDALVTLTPDGIAIPCGFVAMRLRDLARYGMLYTPSWSRAAREQVVSADMVKRIQTGALAGRPARSSGGEVPNSRQWDWVFPDGDIFKSGMHGQGLYVSPGKDLVIAWYSMAASTDLPKYARALAETYASGK